MTAKLQRDTIEIWTNLDNTEGVIIVSSILCCYLAHFMPNLEKQRFNLKKNSLCYGKWNFLALVLENGLYFLIFWEKETPRNGNPKKLFIYPEMKPCTFSAQSRKTKIHPEKFLLFREMELSHSKIKKLFMLSQKKAYLIFPGVEPCTFRAKAGKKKLLYTNIKTFLFSQKKVFLIFLHFSYILFF